jgi:hypothetical protein
LDLVDKIARLSSSLYIEVSISSTQKATARSLAALLCGVVGGASAADVRARAICRRRPTKLRAGDRGVFDEVEPP